VDGVLRWQLQGVEDAVVSARIRRPVRDGYDFDIVLENKGNGVYEAQFNLPLPGQWTAILKSIWNNQQFQTTHELMAR
jgi:nitrogen fixation protein FixH